jgi:hypothetical protein
MAKIVSQTSIFDYSEIEILGDIERLRLAFDGIDDEPLMRVLEKKRGKGRNDYPVRVMWNLIVAMKVFGHRTIESFRRELSRNSQLRKYCGLNDFSGKKHLIPPARVFSGFFKLLQAEQEEVDRMFAFMVGKLYEWLPGFGENLAGERNTTRSIQRRNTISRTKTEKSERSQKPTMGLRRTSYAMSGQNCR